MIHLAITSQDDGAAARGSRRLLVVVALAALAVGAPTLTGRFVGGDDRRLVLDHVLVNRPSFDHAWRLICDVRPHRDLYQPVPLLSFSAEFALLELFGLRADLPWPDGGAWFFHLTNALLHAVNACLVLALLRRWTRDDVVAAIAALIFAVHPLQVETVAWVNGRMMLLSTMFALAALLSADRLCLARRSEETPTEDAGSRGQGGAVFVRRAAGISALTVGFALLSLTSKVRVGLPILMLLIPALRRCRPGRAFWACWALTAGMTGAFAWINVHATAEHDMFANAAAQMTGSRFVRCVLALGWYLEHFIWPSGLAAWYEAPKAPGWGDAATWRACGVLAAAAMLSAWSWRRSNVGAICAAWFLLGIGDTLPIVPARNVLAADRYMYLPIIGLAWAAAALTGLLRSRSSAKSPGIPRFRRAGAAALIGAGAILMAVSWRTAAHYVDMVAKTRRIVAVHPDSPWVHEKLAWALYNAGQYPEAIEAGRTEFERFREVSGAEALTIIGLSQAALGDRAAAIATLRDAVSQRRGALATYYLAATLADAPGNEDEAARLFLDSLEALPNFNPGLSRAAAFFLRIGRWEDARAFYEKVLVNNPFDLNATFELSRLDLNAGDPLAAARRLEAAMTWAPDFVQGRTNLGVCFERLGRVEDAIRQYETAIAADPRAVEALLNLARLNEEGGRLDDAEALLGRAVEAGGRSPPVCAAMHDFRIRAAAPRDAAQFWTTVAAYRALEPPELVRQACALALAGDFDSAEDVAASVADAASPAHFDAAAQDQLEAALRAIEAWRDRRPADAIDPIDRLAASASPILRPAQETLLASFLAELRKNPEDPWLYYLCGALQNALGRPEVARAALEVFIELCPDPTWRDHARRKRQTDSP
ncbi:MAG: hypothetical protein FLDDKLPJ_01924 [Phycisphaerae bacterium]|nr:hypothetical protein [Phycisphaerae bacterium]